MPIQPNFLERTAFFTLNQAPGVMLDLAGAMAYQAVSTAARLDIFQALRTRESTADELSRQLGLQERGVQSLLLALDAIGYVEQKNGRYANTAMTNKWILDSEVLDTEATLRFWDEAMRDLWSHAADVIQTGKRPYSFYNWVEAEDERSRSFQQTLIGNARIVGKDVARKLDLPSTASRLLDVGGGHGVHSIIHCQQYPNLNATIIDSHVGLEVARQKIVQEELQDRITPVAGDLWEVEWGQNYDVVLLFNLIHHYDLETNARLLQKTATALKPGGKVAILDQIAGKVPGAAVNAVVRLIALQYHLFADGRVFTYDEIAQILAETGFQLLQFHKLAKSPGTSLIVATKS